MKLNTDMERCEDFDPEDYDYEMRNAHYTTQGIFKLFFLYNIIDKVLFLKSKRYVKYIIIDSMIEPHVFYFMRIHIIDR